MNGKARICSRREFVKQTGALVGGVAACSSVALSGRVSAAEGPLRVPQSVLGRTGEKVSKLGIGCIHFKRPHVTVEDVRKTLYRALELGVNYLDVAPNYGNEKDGFSEEKMGPAIKEIRDRVFLVTKTEEPSYEGTWKLLRQSMSRLKTDYFDLVHIHNFGHEPRFPDLDVTLGKQGALGALLEAQKQGVVRYIGASGHLHPSRFHRALDTGKIDVLMNGVNFICQHTYDFEHKVWSRARGENVGLVAMKVLGGAGKGQQGFRIPEHLYANAIRYALDIPGVSVAVIGLENIAELEKAAETVAGAAPLSEEESHEMARVGLELAKSDEWKAAYGDPVT
jgi:aryl-alcohol dehydrogenase-like predicted oxidoreductase